MVKVNELLVDKSLIIKNFETYKLSLDKFRTSKENISEGIHIKHPNDEQYSFLHHKEFCLHNHLYYDMWTDNDVYFINSNGKVKKALLNLQTENLFGLIDIWEIPNFSTVSSNFNASINFTTSNLAVISDGFGSIYIIDTSNRTEISNWKVLHSEVAEENKEFKVVSSRLNEKTETKELHCILLSIENSPLNTSSQNSKTSKFVSVLKWIIFTENNDGSWTKKLNDEFKSKSLADYACLEPSCEGLYIISESEFNSPKVLEELEIQKNLKQEKESKVEDYSWQQNRDEIKIWVIFPENVEKTDLKIIINTDQLEIKLKDSVFLSGKLYQNVDAGLTVWSHNNHKLEITLQKEESGAMWSSLLQDCQIIGKEIINEEFAAEVHERLKHLCSENEEEGDAAMLNSGELEDCDALGETRFLNRYQVNSGIITHSIMLGGEQWLFPVHLIDVKVGAFCMRRDVDGLVWQPEQPNLNNEQFTCKHVHTFPALGYIAASKEDKKFLVSPPDLNYVAIVNAFGRVLLFRKTNLSSGSELRNRKTSSACNSLFVQNLINLETSNQTVGAVACNKFLYVLTVKELIMIKIGND